MVIVVLVELAFATLRTSSRNKKGESTNALPFIYRPFSFY